MSIKKLSFNTLVYALGPQLPKLVSLFMLPIITPHLTEKDYGLFGTLMAYTAAITAVKDLGLTSVLSVTFFKYPNKFKFYWNKLYTISIIWAIPLSLFLALILFLVLPFEEKNNFIRIALLTCLPIILFEPSKWIGRKYFQLIERPIPIVINNIVASLAGVLANYITIVKFEMGYMGWFISSFIISFVTFLPYLWVLFRKIKIRLDFNINKKWISRYLAIGLPVLPHFYSIYLLDASDRLILGWYNISFENIGLYSLAYTIGGYFAIVGNALGDATGPMYIKFFSTQKLDDEIKARNLTSIMQLLVIVLAFVIALWLKEIFSILIKNDSLKIGYSMAILILMSFSYRPIYFGPINKLQYLLKTKELWKISFVAGIVNVVLNIILIPFIGIWGSVIATFLAMMFMGFRGYLLQSFKENNPVNYYPLFWFLAICGSTVLVFFIRDIHFMYKLVITFVLLAGATYFYYKHKLKLAF